MDHPGRFADAPPSLLQILNLEFCHMSAREIVCIRSFSRHFAVAVPFQKVDCFRSSFGPIPIFHSSKECTILMLGPMTFTANVTKHHNLKGAIVYPLWPGANGRVWLHLRVSE